MPGWQWLSPRSLVVRPVDRPDPAAAAAGRRPALLRLVGTGRPTYWGLALRGLAIADQHRALAAPPGTGSPPSAIYLRHGLLSQKVLSVPRDRVRSVDLTAHVVYRLLGCARCIVGTGRNDRRDGGSLHLDALRLADAEALRAALLAGAGLAGRAGGRGVRPWPGVAAGWRAGRGAGPVAAERCRTAPRPVGVAELARLRPGWIRFAPLTHHRPGHRRRRARHHRASSSTTRTSTSPRSGRCTG